MSRHRDRRRPARSRVPSELSDLQLACGRRVLDLGRVHVMGVLNVTPDSFSDGGRYCTVDAAVTQAARLVAEGATLIDVGAESTRPGAAPVSEQAELDRLLPVLAALADRFDVVLSVDTSSPAAMTAAAQLGAGLINDVRALQRPGALAAAAATGLPVCLMHMQGEPTHMQAAPQYAQVVTEVAAFLAARVAACEAAGIDRARLLLDPGFGFGKSLSHNLTLLAELSRLTALSLPLLVGVSRKSMLGAVLGGAPVDRRLHAGLAAAVLAAERGARIIRTHDVAPTVEALALWSAQRDARQL